MDYHLNDYEIQEILRRESQRKEKYMEELRLLERQREEEARWFEQEFEK